MYYCDKGGILIMNYQDRCILYDSIERERDSKVILYVTGDRRNLETIISDDMIHLLTDHLDLIGVQRKISLILYTRGGNTLAAWSIVNLIKMFCDELEVIIPSRALSAGTLIAIGANRIIMTKQATLGPIDPSISTPLNPLGQNKVPFPVSVEEVKGYLELSKKDLGIRWGNGLSTVIGKLSDNIHPLILGQAYRTRAQIRMLAEKLLKPNIEKGSTRHKIISFLCSDSGSHDYTINRREAKDILGLNIEKPSYELYNIIKLIYDSFSNELSLNILFNPGLLLSDHPDNEPYRYKFPRCLLESISGGSHQFISEGIFIKNKDRIIDNRKFEGWRLEHDSRNQQ